MAKGRDKRRRQQKKLKRKGIDPVKVRAEKKVKKQAKRAARQS